MVEASTITLMGELDIAVVDDVRDMVKRVVAHEWLTAMHVDVTRVKCIDSAGLMCLVRARQVALESSLAFTLATEQHGPVDRVIDLCGFGGWFTDKPPDAGLWVWRPERAGAGVNAGRIQ